jgi:membrane protein YqaA with SNARE-associated domain
MRSFSRWIIALFASPVGVVILGALDSTVFFSLPLGIDTAVVILAARMRDVWWIVPLLATAGSVAGAAISFWMGVVIGEKGLDRYVPPKRLKKVRAKIKDSGAIALAVLDLIPPPFPFTPFVLAAGALEVSAWLFFVTLAACRLLRFGVEAALARTYGRRIIAMLDSDLFHDIVFFFMVLALVLTVLSLVRLARSRGPARRHAAA